MITIKHKTTGKVQFVTSLAGINLTTWEATATPAPGDLASKAYRGVDGVAVPVERALSKTEFLDLWTPGETVAVMQSTDPMMAFFWARTLAWDGEFLLSDSRIIAGAQHAQSLNILTAARATRILSGQPPL